MKQFYFNVSSNNHDIILLSETWLPDDVYSNELFNLSVYNVFCSKNGRRGRGLITAVNNSFSVEMCTNEPLDQLDIDLLVTKVTIDKNHILLFVNVYVPPGSPVSTYESCYDQIEALMSNTTATLIVGDFNITEYYDCHSKLRNDTTLFSNINSFMNFNNLRQRNIVLNHNNRILDLVLSDADWCEVVQPEEPLVREDAHHPALLISLVIPTTIHNYNFTPETGKYVYDFTKANFQQLYHEMAIKDWTDLYSMTDANLCSEMLTNEILHLFDLYVPKKIRKISPYPRWFSQKTIHNIKLKTRLWKQYKNNNSTYILRRIKQLNSTIKSAQKADLQSHISQSKTI